MQNQKIMVRAQRDKQAFVYGHMTREKKDTFARSQ